MTTETLTLSDFLLARYAELAHIALAATDGPWKDEVLGSEGYEVRAPAVPWKPGAEVTRRPRVARCGYEEWDVDRANAAHIATHHPTYELADIESKRKIVEWHENWPVLVETRPQLEPTDDIHGMTLSMSKQIAWQTEREYRERFGTEPPTSPVLRMLALPFADHPDYRQEWAL